MKGKLFGEQIDIFPNSQATEHHEGDTKEGKGGTLTLKNHRWRLQDEINGKQIWEKPAEYSNDPDQSNMFDSGEAGQQGRSEIPLNQVKIEKEEKNRELIAKANAERTERRNTLAERHIREAKIQKEMFLNDLDEIATLVNLEPVNKEFGVFAITSKESVVSQIKRNYDETGTEDIDSALSGLIVMEKSSQLKDVLEHLEKFGYDLDSSEIDLKDKDFFEAVNITKGENDTTPKQVIFASPEMYNAYLETQRKPIRLEESKMSLQIKLKAEEIKEYQLLKRQFVDSVGKGKGEVMLTAGLPGSGKSTVLNAGFFSGKVIVDPDVIMYNLAQKRGKGIEEVNKNPEKFENDGNVIAQALIREAIREGKDVVYDSTLEDLEHANDFLNLARSGGYTTEFNFLHIPYEESVKRNKEKRSKGGRAYTDQKYKSLFNGNRVYRNYFSMKDSVDRFRFIDNSNPLGTKPKMLSKKTEEAGEKVFYAKNLFDIQQQAFFAKSITGDLENGRSKNKITFRLGRLRHTEHTAKSRGTRLRVGTTEIAWIDNGRLKANTAGRGGVSEGTKKENNKSLVKAFQEKLKSRFVRN